MLDKRTAYPHNGCMTTSRTTSKTARYHVVICGLGQDAETREDVNAMLAADTGWQDEGEYATILDRETGEEFTV